MKRTLLISIHPKWAEKILNGEKTIEIRTWMPKDYAGWVYVYVTKGKDILTFEYASVDNINIVDYPCGYTVVKKLRNDIYIFHDGSLNGKVAFRFWYEKVEEIVAFGDKATIEKNRQILKLACLTPWQANEYLLKDPLDRSTRLIGYAWHIDKLEIFDKPKELSEFIHYRQETIYCGMDCPPYTDWVEYPVRKAPQKCMWVYGGEQS